MDGGVGSRIAIGCSSVSSLDPHTAGATCRNLGNHDGRRSKGIGIGAGASHSFARMAPLRAKYGSGYQLELFSNDRRGARAGAQIANMREGEENLGQQVRGTEIPGITPMTEDISAAK